MRQQHVTMLAMLMATLSCTEQPQEAERAEKQKQPVEDIQRVRVGVATEGRFHNELVSNGKAVAGTYADIYWEVDGVLDDVRVRNGSRVKRGEVVARIDDWRIRNNVQSQQASVDHARLNMLEVLIGQGYTSDSTEEIPAKVRELAEVRSGYRQAVAQLRNMEYDLEHASLRSPISGVVANMEECVGNRVGRNKAFCRIIDPSSLSAEFTVIETEVPMVSVGTKISVTVFSLPGEKKTGHIEEVNPYVERNGMIRVKAKIDNPTGIYEGMNLNVSIEHDAGQMLSVPKSAVVMRSGRPVVFVAKNHEAQWRYVETGLENAESIAIMSGLSAGDSVVVQGNAYLAHESKIDY